MNISPFVTPEFRNLAFNTYPGLGKKPAFAGLFLYLLAPPLCEPTTGFAILSSKACAYLEGKEHQLQSRNYRAQQFIDEYRSLTGHNFEYAQHDYLEGRARVVINLNLDPQVHTAWNQELLTLSNHAVDFVTGRKKTAQNVANRRKADNRAADDHQSKYPETQAAIDYMNRVPAQRASRALNAHYAEAVLAADAFSSKVKRNQDLVTLRLMRDQPKQFFRASKKNRGRRLFPAHRGYGTLSKEIAAIIGQDWYEFDLRSSQLAICASLWGVEEVILFLEYGGNIWEELSTYLRLDKDMKPMFKDVVYALTYGASKARILEEIERYDRFGESLPTEIGQRLLQHPFMVAIRAARNKQLDRISQNNGAYDCYNKWVPIPMDRDKWRNQSPNPRSVLATLSQAVEFKILSPVFELAQSTNDFYITHFAHDGFCLDFTDKRRAESWIRRITNAVTAQAQSLGICTVLEMSRTPARS